MTHQIPPAESATIIAALLQSARRFGLNTPSYRVLMRHADEIRRGIEREAANAMTSKMTMTKRTVGRWRMNEVLSLRESRPRCRDGKRPDGAECSEVPQRLKYNAGRAEWHGSIESPPLTYSLMNSMLLPVMLLADLALFLRPILNLRDGFLDREQLAMLAEPPECGLAGDALDDFKIP
jgi:hypothetical protein